MSVAEFTTTLVAIAQRLDTKKYTKHKRGPKKPHPKSSVASIKRMCLPRIFWRCEDNQQTFTGLVLTPQPPPAMKGAAK
jgi:hypothetical protein